MSGWAFITNHGAVLALIAEHGQITVREIAARLGITERSVHRIIADLEAEGYIQKGRNGRLNWYEVDHDMPIRHREVLDIPVGRLLDVLLSGNSG